MRLSKFAQYAASAKAALTSRDAQSTGKNLETINAGLLKLTEIVRAYTGGLLAASSISNQEAALGQDIKNATADAKAEAPVGDDETKAIMGYIENTLEPNIKANMTALKEKKSELAASNLQTTTLGDLQDLRALTNAYGEAMVANAPAHLQEQGKKLNALIDASFEDAIKFFS